jgi:hypothetical protein
VRSRSLPDRSALEELSFVGVGGDDAAFLRGRFAGPVERTELAAGVPAADRRLEASLAALGFTRPAVLSRELSPDGRRLALELATGPRRTIGAVTLDGVVEPERAHLAAALPIGPGDPARADRIQLAALTVGRTSSARLGRRATPIETPPKPRRRPPRRRRRYASPGSLRRLRWTGERFARAVADLPGAPFRRARSAGRAASCSHGLFSRCARVEKPRRTQRSRSTCERPLQSRLWRAGTRGRLVAGGRRSTAMPSTAVTAGARAI